MPPPTPPLSVKPNDHEDVAVALRAAATCAAKGDRAEALKWVRRAVEAASEAEDDERSLELAKVAADMTTQMVSVPPPRPSAPAPPVHPTAPRGAPLAPRPSASVRPLAPLPARTQPAKEAPKKEGRKSVTSETSRGAHATAQSAKPERGGAAAPLDPPRKRAASRTDRTEVQRKPSKTDDIDAWPTEVVGGNDLPSSVRVVDPAKGSPDQEVTPALRSSQAVKVLLWREPSGLQITAVGSPRPAPSHAVEATLVGSDADTDLIALLTD